ncbi:MAG: 4-(cytidine 5'-diphospho)-2-C-methyl-D-erythritol kinase [Candidatus Zixiibacteriota bacterium]
MIRLKSFAKINLCLYVLGKRKDGYHEIYTVMQAVDLYDGLSLYKIPKGIVVQTDDPQLPTDRRNLVYKAAEIYFNRTGIDEGVRIKIQKKIPLSSGLGGGSSNAAFTLRGLNKLFATRLSQRELWEMAKKIGSDVPFFLSSGQAVTTGRGEKIREVKLPQDYWIILINPYQKIPTSWVYENYKINLTRERKLIKIYKSNKSFLDSMVGWENELEKTAVKKYPQLKRLREKLKQIGAIKTSMSGSGLTVYGIFLDKPRYKEVKSLQSKEWQIRVTRPIPLLVL